MCGLKCSIRVVAITLIIQSGHLISTGPHNGTAEILWHLSHLAIKGRQTQNPSQFQLHPERFSHYTGPIKPNPLARRPYDYLHYPRPGLYQPYPTIPQGFPRPIPALPPGYQRYPQTFTGALETIVQNDELRCIPRLLCELTSGRPDQKQETILPFNINMDSILGLLSGISGVGSSPLVHFGRAVLLGYTSKGNTGSCTYAYPRCPQDADRLVDYLNNYNGGFFRFFNGLPQLGYPQIPQRPLFPPPQRPLYPQHPQIPHRYQQIPQNYPVYPQYHPSPSHSQQYYPNRHIQAQRRIQTKPSDSNPTIRFPNHSLYDISNEVVPQQEPFVFSGQIHFNEEEQQVREHKSRKQKAVAFPVGTFHFPQTPPNLKQANSIFPDRTGTEELRLDEEELNVKPNYDYSYYAPAQPGSYYRKNKEFNLYGGQQPIFRFPSKDYDL